MTVYGYARVSTRQQTLDAQRDALARAGCDKIYQEKISGAVAARPELAAVLAALEPGDTLVVTSLDRLGRSLAGIMVTIAELHGKGVILRSLREGIDYSTPTGRMIAGIFAVLAEYERELIKERQQAAYEAARVRGKRIGRPLALTDDQLAMARRMISAGEPVTMVAAALRVGRSTLYRALAS